jgi:predicted dehydrogenase
MPQDRAIGVGIIGLGFMGRTHLRAYADAHAAGFANRLVAVADQKEDRRRGAGAAAGNLAAAAASETLFDPALVRGYADAEALLRDPEIGLVSICTPTDSHVEIAMAALAAKKHVLVEKPVGVDAATIKPLVALARRRKSLLCMPALCIRFWPAYAWLAQRIKDAAFGKVASAVFQRLGAHPGWSAFYRDPKASGGALVDLHLHDADFIRYALGEPSAVTSTGSLDHVTTLYHYDGGPKHVVAEGGWDHSEGFAFRMRFIVVFEHATVDFDFGRPDQLVLAQNGVSQPVALEPLAGYDVEIRYLLAAIRDKKRDLLATVESAYRTARLLDAERQSLERRRTVKLAR